MKRARCKAWVVMSFLATTFGPLAGCGGGGGGASVSNPDADPGNDPPSAQIEGVATPSSVAVVTATNAD